MQSPKADEEIREVQDVFAKYAVKGRLSVANLETALRQLGQYLTKAQSGELEKEFPSGELTSDDFTVAFQSIQEQNASSDIVEAFASLDKDKTGFIEAAEVVKLLVEVGNVDAETASGMIEPDGPNGTISFQCLADAIGGLIG